MRSAERIPTPNPFVRKLEAYAPLKTESRHEIEALTSHADHLGAHVRVSHEDDKDRVVTVLLSGWASLQRILPDGRRQIIALLLPGDLCDPDVLLPGSKNSHVNTLTRVTLAKVPVATLRALATGSADLAEALRWQAMVALITQREWTVSLGRRSAIERVAHLLCEVWTRLDTIGLANGSDCDLLLTQGDLADAMGLSAVHANRVLRELRVAGLAEVQRRRLVILDRQRLANLAMFDPAYLHRRPA